MVTHSRPYPPYTLVILYRSKFSEPSLTHLTLHQLTLNTFLDLLYNELRRRIDLLIRELTCWASFQRNKAKQPCRCSNYPNPITAIGGKSVDDVRIGGRNERTNMSEMDRFTFVRNVYFIGQSSSLDARNAGPVRNCLLFMISAVVRGLVHQSAGFSPPGSHAQATNLPSLNSLVD